MPKLNQYYLHLFDRTQADLNWDNPEVRREMRDIVRFWMEKGVKGFRFDVVNLISKGAFNDDDQGDGRRFYTDGPRVHDYLQELNRDLRPGRRYPYRRRNVLHLHGKLLPIRRRG